MCWSGLPKALPSSRRGPFRCCHGGRWSSCRQGFSSLSAIILNGGLPLHREVARLVTGIGLRLPIVATELRTFETATAMANTHGRVTAASRRKIDTAIELVQRYVDVDDLIAQLAIPIPTVTTPQMFTTS